MLELKLTMHQLKPVPMTVVASGAVDAVFAVLDSRCDPQAQKKLAADKLRAATEAAALLAASFENVADALEARAKKVLSHMRCS